jgi:DNA-binding SARP family transcriptional activator
MQRALLAILLLHANSYISTSRIIDLLWDGRPPRTASSVLQMYVTAVRRALAPSATRQRDHQNHAMLRTAPSGYGLWVAAGQLDLEQFRALAGRGRRLRAVSRCAPAADAFQRALELWRGPALIDLEHAGAFEPYIVRLEEERLGVFQERVGVDLCQGRSLAIVGELAELHRRHPLSESLCQQLMLALHLAGRRADALRVYAQMRAALIGELGIEPGPGLQATQRAILGSWNFPDTGYPRHAPPRPDQIRVCDPQLFGGWPREERSA